MTDLPDFDTLRWMAEHNPQQLDLLQETMNQEAIAASDVNQAQLKRVKHNLDQHLALCVNPYQRCVVTVSMMRDKLSTLALIINQPDDFYQQSAKVMVFQGK
jgi:hypothetical protein